jgi:hypothetical protein
MTRVAVLSVSLGSELVAGHAVAPSLSARLVMSLQHWKGGCEPGGAGLSINTWSCVPVELNPDCCLRLGGIRNAGKVL